MKNLLAVVLIASLLAPTSSPVFAATPEEQKEIVDVGNKMCPITGEKVDGKSFTVYDGKRYGFCCPGCDTTFLKDPEKYIAQIRATEKDLKF